MTNTLTLIFNFCLWHILLIFNSLCRGMTILGAIALLLALIGVLQTVVGRGCWAVFLATISVVALSELALIITLFANFDSSVKNLVKYDMENADPEDEKKDEKELTKSYSDDLKVGRYIFLVLVIIEIIVIIVTVVVHVRNPHEEEPETLEEQRAARSAMAQIQMESLKNSTSRSSASPGMDSNSFYTGSAKMYKSVTRKMTEKYGQFTQDPAFQKKWWRKLPFFK